MGLLSYAFFVHLVCFRIFPFDDLFSTLIFPLHILSRVWVQINPVTMDMDDVDSSIRESQDGGGMVTFNFYCSCVIVSYYVLFIRHKWNVGGAMMVKGRRGGS
jgi:hypothetical protein